MPDIGDNLVGAICGVSVFLVPISAIIGGYWTKITKMTQEHKLELARIQASQSSTSNDDSLSELNALRQELAALRDTTTQYDLSVERNMQHLLQRLQAVEAKTAPRRESDAPRYAQAQPEEIPLRIQPAG